MVRQEKIAVVRVQKNKGRDNAFWAPVDGRLPDGINLMEFKIIQAYHIREISFQGQVEIGCNTNHIVFDRFGNVSICTTCSHSLERKKRELDFCYMIPTLLQYCHL